MGLNPIFTYKIFTANSFMLSIKHQTPSTLADLCFIAVQIDYQNFLRNPELFIAIY